MNITNHHSRSALTFKSLERSLQRKELTLILELVTTLAQFLFALEIFSMNLRPNIVYLKRPKKRRELLNLRKLKRKKKRKLHLKAVILKPEEKEVLLLNKMLSQLKKRRKRKK